MKHKTQGTDDDEGIRNTSRKLARTVKPMIDLVIPVGPVEVDRDKMGVASNLAPKALAHLGNKPMLWHVLHQVSRIEKRIARIHLLLTNHGNGPDTYNAVEAFLDDLKPPMWKKIHQVAPLNERKTLTPHFHNLNFESEHFLLHYHDILLDDENDSLFLDLLDTYFEAQNRKERSLGTLAVSDHVPEGFQPSRIPTGQKQLGIVHEIMQKPFNLVTVGALDAGPRDIPQYQLVNMAIAVFSRELLRLTKDAASEPSIGDFFQLVSEVKRATSRRNVPISAHLFQGKWWHMDTLGDITAQQSRPNNEHWYGLASRRKKAMNG